MFVGMKLLDLNVKDSWPDQWVVNCIEVSRCHQALIDLGRYLYRGVLAPKNFLYHQQRIFAFQVKVHDGQEVMQGLPGAEFPWRLQLHLLPRRFRGFRDFGLLHGSANRLIRLVQLLTAQQKGTMPIRCGTPQRWRSWIYTYCPAKAQPKHGQIHEVSPDQLGACIQ